MAAAFAGGTVIASSTGHTFASFSDFREVQVKAGAGTWGPTIPPECADISFNNIVYVAPGLRSYVGTNQNDLIFANDLGDTIHGGDGDDCIVGGTGNDSLYGDNGKDVVIGGAGNDTLTGDNAKDQLYGGADDDTLYGGNAPDLLNGGLGNNTCYGGHAPDFVVVPCTQGSAA